MRYTVVYDPDPEAHLANLWISAADRAAFSAASNTMDRLLKFRPLELAEPRGDGSRRLVVAPLAVIYQVRPDDRIVRVVQVELLES